jgi:CRAL/TRIO domain
MLHFAFPLCSYLPHPSPTTPISSAVTIIDLQDVSLGFMWALRNHFQEASRLATDNYPETLGTTVVVNSPAFFPTVWSWVKVRSFFISYFFFV